MEKYFNKILMLLLFMIINNLNAQKSITITGSDYGNSGQKYSFKCDVLYKVHSHGTANNSATYTNVPKGITLAISNYQITEVVKNNKNANEISSIILPKNCTGVIGKISGRIKLFYGNKFWMTTFTQDNIGSSGNFTDDYDFSFNDIISIKNTFGKDITDDQVNVTISNVQVKSLSGSNCSSSISMEIESYLRKLNGLKSQVNSLGNTEKDLLKKKELYNQLAQIDTESNYNYELNKVKTDMQVLALKEINQESEKKETNDSNTASDLWKKIDINPTTLYRY